MNYKRYKLLEPNYDPLILFKILDAYCIFLYRSFRSIAKTLPLSLLMGNPLAIVFRGYQIPSASDKHVLLVKVAYTL
jgi:hypothetical protein